MDSLRYWVMKCMSTLSLDLASAVAGNPTFSTLVPAFFDAVRHGSAVSRAKLIASLGQSARRAIGSAASRPGWSELERQFRTYLCAVGRGDESRLAEPGVRASLTRAFNAII